MNSNYRNLKSYIPSVYNQVDEIEALLDIEEPLFKKILLEVEKAFDNTSVLKADSDGLKMFEEMLGIVATPSESLEFRRFRIINRMSLKPPLSLRWLKSVLDESVGEGNYSCYVDYNNYTLHIDAVTRDRSWYEELLYTVNSNKPCNIEFVITNNFFEEIQNILYRKSIVSRCKIIQLQEREEQ